MAVAREQRDRHAGHGSRGGDLGRSEAADGLSVTLSCAYLRVPGCRSHPSGRCVTLADGATGGARARRHHPR